MAKDYVKRPKAPAKKQATRRKPSKQASIPMPWVKVFVSLMVVALFVFGLYKLQSMDAVNSDNDEMVLSDEIVAPDDITKDTSANIPQPNDSLEQAELPELPVLGEEEWEYIDSLPEFSVEVDATGPLVRNRDFIMQCGSFRTSERAEELKAKIAFQGLESRVLESNGRDGLWYRVVLGPYKRKRNAEKHKHQLSKGNLNGCVIW